MSFCLFVLRIPYIIYYWLYSHTYSLNKCRPIYMCTCKFALFCWYPHIYTILHVFVYISRSSIDLEQVVTIGPLEVDSSSVHGNDSLLKPPFSYKFKHLAKLVSRFIIAVSLTVIWDDSFYIFIAKCVCRSRWIQVPRQWMTRSTQKLEEWGTGFVKHCASKFFRN